MTDVAAACYVYIITAVGQSKPCKIGISDDPWKRAVKLSTGSPVPLRVSEIYGFESRREAHSVEGLFHTAHADGRLNGEWFDVEYEEANYWLFKETMRDVFA